LGIFVVPLFPQSAAPPRLASLWEKFPEELNLSWIYFRWQRAEPRPAGGSLGAGPHTRSTTFWICRKIRCRGDYFTGSVTVMI
jgi:hypothetical protein